MMYEKEGREGARERALGPQTPARVPNIVGTFASLGVFFV